MANTFIIPLINSFRWRLKNVDTDPRYNSLPFDDVVDESCYNAKWQTNDRSQIQLLSDYEPTLELRDYWTDEVIEEITIPEVDFNILDVSFKCYQAEIVWGIYGEGDYYLTLTYNDGVNDIIWETSPLEVRDTQPQTILLECANTKNIGDVIFDTGIVFNFRVEGFRNRRFLPKAESQIYTDQIHNNTQENSTPFRNFTLFIGNAIGLPNWVIDKINRLLTLNNKQVDGTYYERVGNDTQLEVGARPEIGLNEDGWWTIDVSETINNNGNSYITGSNANDDYIVVRKSESFLNKGADFVASGLFKTNSVLDYATITNKSLVPFTIKFGTTNGGSEIAEQEVSEDLTSVITFRHRFETAQDVYISGIDDVTLDIWLAYDQLDAKPSPVPTPGSGGFFKNTVYMYEERNDGEFETHWDIATGLGREDTDFFGCALSDGRNGTLDRSNQFIRGFDRTQPTQRDTLVGANQVTLAKPNLPSIVLSLSRDRKSGNSGVDLLSTAPIGSLPYGDFNVQLGNDTATPFDIIPHSRVTVLFVKISD